MNRPRPSTRLDEAFVSQLLVALEDGEGIDPILRRDVPHRGKGIAFLEHAVEDHRDDAVAKLAIDRLAVAPLTVHPVLGRAPYKRRRASVRPVEVETRV